MLATAAMWGAFPCLLPPHLPNTSVCGFGRSLVLQSCLLQLLVLHQQAKATVCNGIFKAEAQTNSTTLRDLGGIFDRISGLRRGSLLLDIPQQLSMSFPPSPSCEAPRSRSPVSLAVRLTGGLPCVLKSSARRHSKFTKLMRTWPPKQASRQGREQAGLLRVQLLLLPLVCSTPACVFVRSTVFAFCALLSARIPSAAGEGLGCFRFHPSCPSCFVEASERSVSPGVSLFCARFALSRLQLLLFEARLSGDCIREGGGQGSQPWVLSACL